LTFEIWYKGEERDMWNARRGLVSVVLRTECALRKVEEKEGPGIVKAWKHGAAEEKQIAEST
jgi:hypothetical protein